MSVKSPVLVLLLSMTVTQQVMACDENSHHMCNPLNQPMSCSNNPRIRVDKSKATHYRLTILCASNHCTKNITINFECCNICDEVCEILDLDLRGENCAHELGLGDEHDLNRQEREAACEDRMDDILNGHCLSTTTPPFTAESGGRASASERDNSLIALGVLFCISVLLLATVTVGWVCTCRYIMTKRDTKRSTVELKGIGTNKEDLKNPSYEINGRASSTGAPAVVAYDVVANTPSQARNPGQMYNILNRGQATGQTRATAAQSTGADRGYSQLGPRDAEQTNK